MDIVTIVCEQDLADIVLQAHTINKFVSPCRHYVTIEDDSLSLDKWYEILSPFYTKHELILTSVPRPENPEFVPHTGMFETKGFGWRRSAMLKLQVASQVFGESALILDCKNIFVRPTDLDQWPFKHGNGRYHYGFDERFPAGKWMHYVVSKTGMKMPPRLPGAMPTPFVFNKEICRKATDHPLFETLFMNNDGVVPAGECDYYYFFVDEEDYDEPQNLVCPAIDNYRIAQGTDPFTNTRFEITTNTDDENYHAQFLEHSINQCVDINSPTHGIHSGIRNYLPQNAKSFYGNWLISLGLDSELVNNYMNPTSFVS